MKVVGEAPSLRPAKLANLILRALRVPWMWLGVGMMAVAFFSLLGALSIYEVSFVVPVTALSYVAGAFGGAVFLREHVMFRTLARSLAGCNRCYAGVFRQELIGSRMSLAGFGQTSWIITTRQQDSKSGPAAGSIVLSTGGLPCPPHPLCPSLPADQKLREVHHWVNGQT